MDDDETRRLILRLQMEDLASIWASSTTSTGDGTEIDADMSLRLCRHELRTADQQIDNEISARAAAKDELRQRDAIRADREEARRLFQELNPHEPLPEPSESDQLLLTNSQDDDNAFTPAKRQDVLTRSFPITFGTIETAIETSASCPAVSGPFTASQGDNPSEPNSSGKSSVRIHHSTSDILSGRGQDTTPSRTARTAGSEALVSQMLPASDQPVAPGQQSSIEPSQPSEVECLACCTDVARTEAYINTCGHPYCRKCLNRLFKTAVRDESLWSPQRCKEEMPIKTIEHLLREDLIPLIKARQVEMSTPLSDRTYCATCTTFLPENRIREKKGTCLKCWTSTCTECKEKDHIGDCQSKLQQDIKDLELLAEKEGWKKCSSCLMFVKHNTGCNHMTCRCKNEFCYLCTRKWRKCKYPFMDLRLLLAREEQRGVAPIGLELCTHGDWKYFSTTDHCDHCGDLMPNYLFRCLGCYFQYCRWCKFDRGLGVA